MRKNFCLTLAVVSVVACGGGYSSNAPPPPTGNTPPPSGGVWVTNSGYSPASKTVTVGASVLWAWNSCTADPNYGGGETCVSHSVTFDDGVTSPTQDKGSFNRTFNAAGTYNYHCAVHAFTGTITVQ